MTTQTQEDKFAHARENASGWFETIKELIERLRKAENFELHDDMSEPENVDDVRREIEEGPLSVMVRDGWRQPGAQTEEGPEEFEILLSTGGPALRIWGTLDQHNQPDDCELQMQDWFLPWTKWVPQPHDETFRDTLRAYAQQFYFGD